MKLALGTVQFGLAYGARSPVAAVSELEISAMLEHAWRRGVDVVDTSPAYGVAEERLGRLVPSGLAFSIVSKTLRLADAGSVAAVVGGVHASCRALGRTSLAAVLVHHAEDLLGPQGAALYRGLCVLQEQGVVGLVGASVYDPETLNSLLARYRLGCVQLPLNVFDQRFLRSGLLDKLADAGSLVHARSAFLQGRLLVDPVSLPQRFDNVRPLLETLRADAERAGLSLPTFLLKFVMEAPAIQKIVVGCDTLGDLRANLDAHDEALANPQPISFSRYHVDDAGIVDPRRWS